MAEIQRTEWGRLADAEARITELSELAAALVAAQEDERACLARELHDEMGALLTASKFELMRVRRAPGVSADVIQKLSALELQINQAIALKRSIIETLRPSSLDHLGLAQSLIILCDTSAASMQMAVHCTVRDVSLNKVAQLAVYRFVQASLANARQHAQATEIGVTLAELNGGADVQVHDDGIGFNVPVARLSNHGLFGMRARFEALGGTLRIVSAPGQGTRIQAWLPSSAPRQCEASDD